MDNGKHGVNWSGYFEFSEQDSIVPPFIHLLGFFLMNNLVNLIFTHALFWLKIEALT